MQIRLTTPDDFSQIAAVLNEQIAHGIAHFGTIPISEAQIDEEWSPIADMYPWLTAIDDQGAFLGFVKSAPWSQRGGYRWTVEVSVYLSKNARGRGIGRALYNELFGILTRQGYVIVFAGASIPNEASDKLHKAMGMEVVGEVTPFGFKQGKWIAVRYYQGLLVDLDSATPPMPIQPVVSVFPA